jgi:hypothetical protein
MTGQNDIPPSFEGVPHKTVVCDRSHDQPRLSGRRRGDFVEFTEKR